jgi:hypothetical protein
MIIEAEQEIMLFPEGTTPAAAVKPTEVAVGATRGGATVDSSGSAPPDAGPARASSAGATGAVSRGYMEEIRHFAVCCRSDGKEKPRCDGRKAMADAVIALKANEAIAGGARIQFDPKWFQA